MADYDMIKLRTLIPILRSHRIGKSSSNPCALLLVGVERIFDAILWAKSEPKEFHAYIISLSLSFDLEVEMQMWVWARILIRHVLLYYKD